MLKNEKSKSQKLLYDFDFFSKISKSRIKIHSGYVVFDHNIPNIRIKCDNRSEIIGLIKIDTDGGQTDRQTNGNLSYARELKTAYRNVTRSWLLLLPGIMKFRTLVLYFIISLNFKITTNITTPIKAKIIILPLEWLFMGAVTS